MKKIHIADVSCLLIALTIYLMAPIAYVGLIILAVLIEWGGSSFVAHLC